MICQDTSHVGPAAQIVLYSYGAMCGSVTVWQQFRNDAISKINDVISRLQSFLTTVQDNEKAVLNKGGVLLSSDSILSIQSYNLNITNLITQIHTLLNILTKNFDTSNSKINQVVDVLTTYSYQNAIDSIAKSIKDKKPCVTNITVEFKKLFEAVQHGINQCTTEYVDDSGINNEISYWFEIYYDKISQLNGCLTSNSRQCVDIVSGFQLLIKLIFYIQIPLSSADYFESTG